MNTDPRATPAARGRSRTKVAIVVAIQLVCVGFVVHSLWQNRRELASTLELGVTAIVLLIALNAIGHVQRTFEFTYMLRRLGVQEPFTEGFLLTGAGFLLNHLPLNAGFVMRAVVLRRDHALPYSSYVSLTLVNSVVNVGVAALVALVGLHFGSADAKVSQVAMRVAFGGLLLVSLAALFLPNMPLPRGKNFVSRQLRNLAAGVELIRGRGGAVLVLALLALTKIMTVALRLGVCFFLLSKPISALGSMLLAAVQNLTATVNLTPGNLGLREFLVSVASTEVGTSQTIGLAAASIDRVVSVIYALATGLPGIYSLRRRGTVPA
jgi:uncharacterized membrane protein YbhN (UPF0104 family)